MLLVHWESPAGHVGATLFQEVLAKTLALAVKVGARKRLITKNGHLYEI
jgi:hypothetical protein